MRRAGCHVLALFLWHTRLVRGWDRQWVGEDAVPAEDRSAA